jgi:hypothetical protein
MRVYSCIDSHGRWTEIPTQVQFSTSNDAHPPQPNPRTSNVGSDVIDIDPDEESEEDSENELEELVTSLSTESDGEDAPDDDPDDNNDPKNKSEAESLEETTACAASPRPSTGIPAQPAVPPKPKPDADGLIWHPHPGYPNQEMSEPDAQGRVRYKIHMTTAASQLPSRETDAERAAELIYRSVIKKYGNP